MWCCRIRIILILIKKSLGKWDLKTFFASMHLKKMLSNYPKCFVIRVHPFLMMSLFFNWAEKFGHFRTWGCQGNSDVPISMWFFRKECKNALFCEFQTLLLDSVQLCELWAWYIHSRLFILLRLYFFNKNSIKQFIMYAVLRNDGIQTDWCWEKGGLVNCLI